MKKLIHTQDQEIHEHIQSHKKLWTEIRELKDERNYYSTKMYELADKIKVLTAGIYRK